MNNVQYVYIAVASLGAIIALLFACSYLPEITEEDMAQQQENAGQIDERPLWKRKHCVFGFVAQFVSCIASGPHKGALTAHTRFKVLRRRTSVRCQLRPQLPHGQGPYEFPSSLWRFLLTIPPRSRSQKSFTSARASQLFSFMQITFTVSNFPFITLTRPLVKVDKPQRVACPTQAWLR